jgi:hypothetical protein
VRRDGLFGCWYSSFAFYETQGLPGGLNRASRRRVRPLIWVGGLGRTSRRPVRPLVLFPIPTLDPGTVMRPQSCLAAASSTAGTAELKKNENKRPKIPLVS